MTRSRSRLANDAWESLLTAHAALMKRFAAEPIWDELTMREYDVLYTLSKHDGPMRLFELGRGVLLSQPALSRLVERLVDRGLLERAADPEDGRGVRLALTEAGRERQRRVGGRHAVDVARAVTAALTDEEMRQLEAIGRKLAARSSTDPTRKEAVL
ncbi:MarR family transcriptional regulator [Glycomyces sp. TRM65418]|uniref:MarR family winged helix-turn-helix transcriptional regulator n=1 Tax=Glycomyces sp. TRM65418 TaxID=2867006 RepID=UPI001CE4ECF3|nr:MarR family transcriptional regulator [Glycomyces sp. TRM65418]MCC3763333.1 MarR family transcriptional regulator [Glycomyces sp. TRM65418]QZD57330.1 MarR family transcriptional regulator [Glycomyces sp. TRM65418]